MHDGAAGHVDRLAGDVLGAVAGEERDDFGDVGWQRDTAEWDRGGLLRDALGPQRRIEASIGPAAEMVETLGVGAPGHTAFTVMPAGASSWASDCVNPITPNFDAQ